MSAPGIALFGLFGRTNLGNEATLAAFLHHLRRRHPGSRLVCIGPANSAVSESHGLGLIDMEPVKVRPFFHGFRTRALRALANVAHRVTEPLRGRRATSHLRDFQLLLVPGTGILDDYGQGPLDLPLTLHRWCRAARRAGIPSYFVSVGAEPVAGRVTRRLFRGAAAHSAYRSYRDDESRRNAAGLGLPADRDPVYPDLAFSLPLEELPALRRVTWPPRCVGVGVMGYYGWSNRQTPEGERTYQAYLASITRFLRWLLDRGHDVRLLVGDTRADERPARELAAAFAAEVDDTGRPRVRFDPVRTHDELLAQLVGTDVVVATRLHNVLLSLLVERPTMSISYSRKTDVLLEEFGLGEYTQPIDALDVDRLQAQFVELASRPEPPVDAIRRRNDEYRRRLDEQYERIFSALLAS